MPKCVESILSQTFKNYELILIDDGSPDNCGKICDDYASHDKRIIVIHQENAGVSTARNKGLDIAQGDYITFIDSDDQIMTKDTLNDNLSIINNDKTIDILQFPVYYYNDGESFRLTHGKGIYNRSGDILKGILNGELTGKLWGKIYRSNLFKSIRLPQGMCFAEDVWCLLDILNNTSKLYISDIGGYTYNNREESAVNTFDTNKCIDLFLMSFKFFRILSSQLERNDKTVVTFFFITYKRLIDTRVASKDSFNYHTYLKFLEKKIPDLSNISKLNIKDKINLILLKIIGINLLSTLYVKVILFRARN